MIAVHYENQYNESKTPSMRAGIELFKIYIKSVVQLVYIMSYVLDHLVELFGKNYDYILTSINERCMIKTHSFLTSFFIRLLHHIKDLTLKREIARQKGENIDSLNMRLVVSHNLFLIVLIESELFVGNFRKLSKRYINSYRLYVMLYLVLRQCMSNPDFFFEQSMKQKLHHEGTNMLAFFTLNELEQVSRMCEEFRSAKEEQNRIKKGKSAIRRKSGVSAGSATASSTNNTPAKLSTSDALGNSPSYYHASGNSGSAGDGTSNGGDLGFTKGLLTQGAGSIINSIIGEASLRSHLEAGRAQIPGGFGGMDGVEGTSHSNSTGSQSPFSSDPSMYSALNNFILGDNPTSQNEDFIKLFDVYNDLDHDEKGSFGF